MNFYESLSYYNRFNQLCRERGAPLDVEAGDRLVYQGRAYIVAAAQGDALALVDDLTGIPLEPTQILYVHEWEADESCFFLPRIEQMLEVIHRQTGLDPMMTPGVKETKPVWQLSHPAAPPIVSDSLERGLLELAIRVLEAAGSEPQEASEEKTIL
ncbi:MAG: hypothetical protein JXR73_11595 [Candidatus Omnitrophica bacterium]|nr:hypothetical protein [Candidatus Omnitrophota bacterium]